MALRRAGGAVAVAVRRRGRAQRRRFSGRSHRACGRAQASEVLAADLRVESDEPIAADEPAQARAAGSDDGAPDHDALGVFRGDANQLANVRAVSAGYPLRGDVTVADRPFAPAPPPRRSRRPARPGPTRGWPPRSARRSARAHRRRTSAARLAHPHLAPRSGLDLRRIRLGTADQRRRPCVDQADPAGQPDPLRAAADRQQRAARCLPRLAPAARAAP